MTSVLLDFQNAPLVIANSSVETTVFSWVIPGGSTNGVCRYRVELHGLVSTIAVLPGAITLRMKIGSLDVPVVNETPLTGVTNARFLSPLDFWLIPGSTDAVAIGGDFTQDGGNMLLPSGPRLNGGSASIDLSQDQALSVTWKFATANSGNVFTREVAALSLLTG